jgi:hypothetical protein
MFGTVFVLLVAEPVVGMHFDPFDFVGFPFVQNRKTSPRPLFVHHVVKLHLGLQIRNLYA